MVVTQGKASTPDLDVGNNVSDFFRAVSQQSRESQLSAVEQSSTFIPSEVANNCRRKGGGRVPGVRSSLRRYGRKPKDSGTGIW